MHSKPSTPSLNSLLDSGATPAFQSSEQATPSVRHAHARALLGPSAHAVQYVTGCPVLSPPPTAHFRSSFRRSASSPPWDTSFKLQMPSVRSR